MLKKIASAAALMAVGGIACAQSSVTVYGIVDTAVEYMGGFKSEVQHPWIQ